MSQGLVELKREFVQLYLDQDGLCHLEDEKGFPNVRNDNGVLFAVYGYMLLHKKNMLDGADFLRFNHTVRTLTVETGLHKRRPNAEHIEEAHDNRVAISAGAVIFDALQVARDQEEYGNRNGYMFTVNKKWKLSQLIQGGDVAFLKLCAGKLPYPTEWLWLLGGMLTAVVKGWSSTWNLFYMRSYALDIVFDRFATSTWVPFKLSWLLVRPVLHLIASKRFGGLKESLRHYFSSSHILYRMETYGTTDS
jgi:hypothetical protein